jgi:hypothetical protein
LKQSANNKVVPNFSIYLKEFSCVFNALRYFFDPKTKFLFKFESEDSVGPTCQWLFLPFMSLQSKAHLSGLFFHADSMPTAAATRHMTPRFTSWPAHSQHRPLHFDQRHPTIHQSLRLRHPVRYSVSKAWQ